jgi:HD-GYP domain-containing protein (c-di-GMP phosphodiesterase class II)
LPPSPCYVSEALAVALHRTGTLWRNCLADTPEQLTRDAVLALGPGERTQLSPDEIDRICEAFSDVVDAKSPFTHRHSIGVALTEERPYRESLGSDQVASIMTKDVPIKLDPECYEALTTAVFQEQFPA